MKPIVYALSVVGAALLLFVSSKHLLPIAMTEALGFLTGALCVWLIIRENIWNWPIGIANNIFYIIVFWRARLFADMSLQFVYIALGLLGWYRWLFGGREHSGVRISRISPGTAIPIALFILAATTSLTFYLRSVHDAAPFLDALTAVLSIAAQYLLTRKVLENWVLWIATNTISIGLYLSKNLPLTSLLYFIFLVMAIAGIVEWRRSFHRSISDSSLQSQPATQ